MSEEQLEIEELNNAKRSPGRPRIHPDTVEGKRKADAKRQAKRRERDTESGYKEVRGIRGTTEERAMLDSVKDALGYKTVREMIFAECKRLADLEGVSYARENLQSEHAHLVADYHYIAEKYGRIADEDLISHQFESLIETPLLIGSVKSLKERISSYFEKGYLFTGKVMQLPNDDHILQEIAERHGIDR